MLHLEASSAADGSVSAAWEATPDRGQEGEWVGARGIFPLGLGFVSL